MLRCDATEVIGDGDGEGIGAVELGVWCVGPGTGGRIDRGGAVAWRVSGVDGKVTKISLSDNGVNIEGVKKDKIKGDKFDVFIHSTNIVITSINSDDKWRMNKLEGKKPRTERVIEEKPEVIKEEKNTKKESKVKTSQTKKVADGNKTKKKEEK